MKRATETLGWIGMILLQAQAIPATIATIQGAANVPLLMPILTALGLSCYLARSLAQKDTLYTVGNSIGLLMSCTLIVAILYS